MSPPTEIYARYNWYVETLRARPAFYSSAEMLVNESQAPWSVLLSPSQTIKGFGLTDQLNLRQVCKALASCAKVADLVMSAFENITIPRLKVFETEEERCAFAKCCGEIDPLRAKENIERYSRVADLLRRIPNSCIAGGFAVEVLTRKTPCEAAADLDIYIPSSSNYSIPMSPAQIEDAHCSSFEIFYAAVEKIVEFYTQYRLECEFVRGDGSDVWKTMKNFEVEILFCMPDFYGEENPAYQPITIRCPSRTTAMEENASRDALYCLALRKSDLRKKFDEVCKQLICGEEFRTESFTRAKLMEMLSVQYPGENCPLFEKMLSENDREIFGNFGSLPILTTSYVKILPTEANNGDQRYRWVEPKANKVITDYGGVLLAFEHTPRLKNSDTYASHKWCHPRVGAVNLIQTIGALRPRQIVDFFDLTCTQVSLTSDGGRLRVHGSSEALEDIKHKRLKFTNAAFPWIHALSTEFDMEEAQERVLCKEIRRVEKYFEKGFV